MNDRENLGWIKGGASDGVGGGGLNKATISGGSAPNPLPTFRLHAATGLHRGGRSYQQDQVVVLTHPRDNGYMLGVVADGMGGRSGGRKAADQVILSATQIFSRYFPDEDSPTDMLRSIVKEAHMVIRLTAISAEEEPHSTIAAFIITPNQDCEWIHCGDSRIYHVRSNQVLRKTSDHSYVQTLVERGEVKIEDASNHPQANILLDCLGGEVMPNPTLTNVTDLQVGDTIVACSDGLWHYFSDQELAEVLTQYEPRESCEYLIQGVHQRSQGRSDNVSLAIIRIEPM